MCQHVFTADAGTPFYCAPEMMKEHRLLRESDVFSYGVIMWGLAHSCPPYISRDGILERHPNFPAFQVHVPLTYTLLAIACMSSSPTDRPSFQQIMEVLTSLNKELECGRYIDAQGNMQVSRT